MFQWLLLIFSMVRIFNGLFRGILTARWIMGRLESYGSSTYVSISSVVAISTNPIFPSLNNYIFIWSTALFGATDWANFKNPYFWPSIFSLYTQLIYVDRWHIDTYHQMLLLIFLPMLIDAYLLESRTNSPVVFLKSFIEVSDTI